jgi:serine protease DegQ
MRRFSLVLFQLVLALLAGYAGGRLAQTPSPRGAAPPPAAPAQTPAPAAQVAPALPPAGTAAGPAPGLTLRAAVQAAAPSVVTVYSARTASRGLLGPAGREILSAGLGSGVVLDGDGSIVTNYHVVEGANELAVAFANGTPQRTQVVGVDPDSDLALLRVQASGLRPITIGEPKNVAVGDVVLAVGNPLGVGQTVTQGIISAIGRKGIGINPIENFIQTDAAINPGNSGGALVDTAGRLIGINSAILSSGGGSEGIGFAIPVDLAQRVVASLKKNGRVARGWLGVSTGAAPGGQTGALVVAVQRGGPAARAGMEPGDVIVRFADHAIEQPNDLVSETLESEPGTKVPVEVSRNGKRQTLDVVLGTRPPLRRTRGG